MVACRRSGNNRGLREYCLNRVERSDCLWHSLFPQLQCGAVAANALLVELATQLRNAHSALVARVLNELEKGRAARLRIFVISHDWHVVLVNNK